ncbi:MAG: histidine kinase [Bryobacteraceae bacterium]|jgi:two-component system NarL family sensor kinase
MLVSHDLLVEFLEQSQGCHWALDSGAVFQFVHGDAMPLFGKPAVELAGREIGEALDAESAGIWRERLVKILGGECLQLRERRGDRVWYVFCFPVRVGGEICYAGATGREVTALATAEQELRNTVLGSLRQQQFERTSIARFLHDSVGQNLTALGLQIDLIRMDVPDSSTEPLARLREVQKLLEQIMAEVRDYSYALNPSAVERAGLRAALDRMGARLRDRIPGTLRINVDPSLRIDPHIASALYHIAEEAVDNAVQHAGCSLIEIAVKSTRNGATLEVRDNGRGFDPSDLQNGSRGLGLLSMEHYAAEAGLELEIQSSRATGTSISAFYSKDPGGKK